MSLLGAIEQIQRKHRAFGWLLTTIGFVLPVIAVCGVMFLFALADFSSQVRDEFEKPPGFGSYLAFALGLSICLLSFVSGLLLIRARFRRSVVHS